MLVEGFRICSSGLQPEVDKCMRKVLGPDWLEKCKLPKQHIWPGGAIDGEGELIDLEGLLHLVVSATQLRRGFTCIFVFASVSTDQQELRS